jgi:hypothetical protein
MLIAEVEKNRLMESEKKLSKLHEEKLATITTTAEKKAKADAARLAEHDERAAKLGSECAALRAELEALGKHQKSSTGQCKSYFLVANSSRSWTVDS